MASSTYRLGDWIVEPDLNRLRSGDVEEHLEPLSMDMLEYLLAHAGETVSTQKLLDVVWSGRVVETGAVHRGINQIRRCLGDDPRQPRYVETIRGRGYRVIARVDRLKGADEASREVEHDLVPRTLRHMGIPAIAVMPFLNLSNDDDQAYFADGLTEDIITRLARFKELAVISRGAVFVHKGRSISPAEIGQEFGVDFVVEGSVRRSLDAVRISIQLTATDGPVHVWAETYDRDLEDVFAIQDDVAASVAATVSGRIEAQARGRLYRKPPECFEAYDCLLKGKVLHHRATPRDNQEAIRLIDRAISLDPSYADAHAWKGCITAQACLNGWVDDLDTAAQLMMSELQIALSLDDDDADVHRMIAAVMINYGELDKASYHQQRALALNRNSDVILLQQGELLTWLGKGEEAIGWFLEAMRLNPYYPERFWTYLGRAQYTAHRYEEALESFCKVSQRPLQFLPFAVAAWAQSGNAAEAATCARRLMSEQPDFCVDAYVNSLQYATREDAEHLRAGLLAAGLRTA